MKKNFFTLILFLTVFTLTAQYKAHWRGGSGNYNDPTKWSNVSGGAPGTYTASNGGNIPVAGDSIVFDANSAATASFVVTVPINSQCANFKVAATCPKLTINVNNGIKLQIFGHCIVDKSDFQFGPAVTSGIVEFADGSVTAVGVPKIIRIAYNPAVFPNKFINTQFSTGEHIIENVFKLHTNRAITVVTGNFNTTFQDSLIAPIDVYQISGVSNYNTSTNSGTHSFNKFVSACVLSVASSNTININCNTELRVLDVLSSASNVSINSTNRSHRIGELSVLGTNNNINFSGSSIKTVVFSSGNTPNTFNFSNCMMQVYDTLKTQFVTNPYFTNFPIYYTTGSPSRKTSFTSGSLSLNMRSLHVLSNDFIKVGSNDRFDSVLIYRGNTYLTSISTSFSISPTGYFKVYPGVYLQHQYSPNMSATSASITIPAAAKFVADGRCDSTIRFRDVFFNFLSATPTATCNNLVIDNSRSSVLAGLNAGANSYKIPGTTTTGWSFGALPTPRILRWTGTVTPPNTQSYARWHNSTSWQNVTTGITPECPPTIYDSIIFPNNSFVRIDNPMAVCKGMNWQGSGTLYDSASIVLGGPFGYGNTGVPIMYNVTRNLEIYGTTTLTKPNQLNWNFKGRVYFRAWQANQFLNPGQQIFRNSVIFDATSDLGGWVLQDSLYAHYSYEGQFGVSGVIFQSAIVNESSQSLVHFNGHLNTNGYTVRTCNYNKASRPIEYQSSLKLGKSKFYIIGKQYGNSVNYRTANFFIQRSNKFSVKADSSEIIYMPTVTAGGQPNLFFGGGYKFFNLTFKGNRGGITTGRNYSGVLRAYTDTFNIITFENNAHIFASDVTSGTFAANVPPLTENIIAKRINFNTLSGYTEIGNTWTSGLLPSYTRSPIRILADSVFYYGNASVDTTSIRYNNISVMYPGKTYNFYYSNHTYPTGSIMQGIGSCANTIVLNKGRFYNNSGADFENPALHLNYFKISEPASLGSDSLVFQNSFEVLPATGKAITRGGKSRVLVWRDGISGISTGNWDDNSKWALATITNSNVAMGSIPFTYTVGSVGECVPTCADTIIFDNQSFDANDGIVLPDNYTAYFHTMRWATQAAITPSFTANMKKGATLNICGSLYLQNNLTFNNGAYTLFTGNTKRDTIDAKGKEICMYVTRFEANNDSVNWVLKSNALFSVNGFTSTVNPASGDSVSLQLVRGHLNINGYLLQTKLFHSTGTNYRKLSMPEIINTLPVRTSTLQVFGSNLSTSAANEAPIMTTGSVIPNIGTNARFAYIVDDVNTGKFQLSAAKNSLLLFQSLPTTTVSYQPSVKYGNNLHYGIVKFNNVASTFINGICFRDTFELMEINPVVSQITTATNSFGSTNNRLSNTNNYIKKLVNKGTLSTAASFSISAVGTRIDSLLCEGGVTITDTTSIANYYKFVPNRTYSFPHNQVTYLFDNCDFKPIGTSGNNIFFVSTLSGSQAWIRKDTGLVCADYCSVVDNWAIGSGKTMPAFTTGGTFPGGSGIGIGACTQPNISRCDTVLASSYYTGTNSGPTLNASPAQNFGKRGIFNGGANFTIGSNTFGWEKTPNPPTPKVAVVSPNITICEGDSLRITFQIEGFGPFKDFVFFSNTNVAGGYPVGSNITNSAPANIGVPSYTAAPSFTYHPGVYPGDSIRPLDPSQPYSTFGTTANPWMYSFWVYPTQSIKYSLGTIGVDRCFNAVSATGIGAMVVTVNPAPKNVAGSIILNPICSNNAAVITGTATQIGNTYYLYDAPTGFTGQQVMTSSTTGTLTTGTYTTSGLTTGTTSTTYTYYVGAESQLGCPSLIRVPVTVTVNPIPQITNTDIQSICTGNTATISPVNNFTAGVTNNWSSAAVAGITGHATTGSSSISETLINTTANPQMLVYTYIPTAAGCAGTAQQFTVTVNPAPTMSSPTNTTICSGNALSFNLSTNIPGSTFNWIASDNTNTTGETTTAQNASNITDAITNNVTSLQIVTYSVIPTGTAGACPGAQQTVTVNVNPTPALTSVNTATLCSGGSFNVPLTSNVASTYTWVAADNTNVIGESTSNQTTSAINNTLSTAVGSSAEVVLYTVIPMSSAGNCLGTAQQVSVTVNSSPSVTVVSSAASICSGNTATLTAGGANTYTWTNPSSTNTVVTVSPATSTNYVVTGTDANGCVNTQTVSLTVNPTPTVAISASSGTICSGQTTTLTAATANTYSWSSGQSVNSISVAPTTNTVYTVIGTNTAGSCTASAQYSVMVNPTPTVNIAATSGTICSGQTTTLTAATANNYSWSSGQTVNAITVAPTTNTVYTVVGTNTAGSCTASAQYSVTVNPTPTVNIAASSGTICSGQTTTLNVGTADMYAWSNGLPSIASNTVAPTANTVYSVVGTNTVGSCTATAQFTVTVNATPTVAISASSGTICSGQTTTLTAATANNYSWSSGQSVNAISVAPTTNTVYTVIGTNTAGSCTVSAQYSVTVNPTPTVAISASSGTICSGQTTTLNVSSADMYTWSHGLPSMASNTVSPSTNTVYSVVGTNTAGSCTATAQFSVTVNQLPAITAGTITNVSCFGLNNGSVNFTNTSGTPGYTISGTNVTGNTASNLSPTDYTYTVTDAAGCQSTTSLSITQPAAALLTSSAETATNTSCTSPDGIATVTITGGTGPGYTITSSPGIVSGTTITGLGTGVYSYTVTDQNNCKTTNTGTITGATGISSTLTAQSNVLCFGNNTASVSVSGLGEASGAYNYTLTNTGTGLAVANNNTGVFTNLPAGTYSVNISGGVSNCVSSQNIFISEPASALSLSGISTGSVICNGGTAAATATISGGTAPYTYAWSTQTSTTTASTNSSATYSAGAYSVDITDANGCTLATQNFTISESPVLAISSVATATTGCGLSDGTATVTVNGGWSSYTYTITDSGNSVISSTNTATSLSAGNYTATIADALGCTTQTVFIISNPITPTLTIASMAPAICAGQTATLTPTGAVSYSLNGTPFSSTLTETVNPTVTTVYNITGTDASNCTSAPLSVTVTVNELPALNLGSSNAAICVGQTATLTAISTGTTTVDTYTWSTATSATNTETVSPSVQTVYTVVGTNTLTGCVSAIQSVTVDVNALPTAAVASQTNITCLNSADGIATFTTDATSYTITPATTGLAAGTHTFTVTDLSTTCTNTVSATIAAPSASLAIASVATTTTGCGLSNGTATITANGGWNTSYTYSVNGTAVTNPLTNLAAASYTADVTDALGCTTQTVFTITNPNTPTLSIASNPAAICAGQSVTLTPTGAVSYTIANPVQSFTTDVVLTPGTTTVYNITGTDASSCTSAPLTVTVNVNALPTVSIAATATAICSGNTVTLTASGADAYVWSSSANTTSIEVVNPSTQTIYTAQGTNTLTGCTSSVAASYTVDVNALPTASITSQNNILCFGQANGSVTIATTPSTAVVSPATTTGLSGGVHTFTITNNGCASVTTVTITEPTSALTASVANTTTNTSCTTPNGAFTVTASGGAPNYTYTSASTNTTGVFTGIGTGTQNITVNDANGCTYTVSATIPGAATPSISAATQTNVLCNGGSTGAASITVINGTPTYTYTWSNNTGLNSNTQVNLAVGPYTVTATDAGSCTVSQVFVITEPGAINAITTQSTAPCVGQQNGSIAIEITGGTPGYNTSWNPSGTVDNSANTSAISNIGEGSYVATVTDANGCSYQYPVMLSAENGAGCTLFIPEIFSPNGDGKNDVWEIKGLENYPDNHVTVFNRWGDQVFEAEPYKNDWDGSNQGDKSILGKGALPAGTYYFILDLGNGDKPITGYVQITK